ncbi:MAG: sulfotransferase domain-containing protein [Chloroflexota bacterium]
MQDTEIFIHIGYHKTGTTFLQHTFFPNLAMNQILFPNVTYLAESQNYEPQQFVNLLVEQAKSTHHPKTIISQETLSGRGDGDSMWDAHLIGERLHTTFPNAKILMVVRNQPDYILSLYTFRVIIRGLERRSLTDYLDAKFERGLRQKLQYHYLVSHYRQLFGEKQVLVLPYELFVEAPKQFINRLLHFFDLQTTFEPENRRVNIGSRNKHILNAHRLINYPFGQSIDFLQQYSLLSQQHYRRVTQAYFYIKRKAIQPILNSALAKGGQTIRYDKDWQETLVVAFRESNATLSQLIDVDLKQYGYPSL